MSKNLRQFLLLLPLAVLLAALGYWNITPDSFERRAGMAAENASIDFFVGNPLTRQFQADGKLNYEIRAERLEHIKQSDITLLTKPDMLLFRGEDLPWHIQSNSGEVSPGGEQVELIDAVSVARTDARGRPTVLTTPRLSVFPEKEYAQTSQAVRIEAANGVTTAVGMKAYLDDGRMLLLSNVRGQHELR
jgi:lipopolysaccharide export system protein LptC